MKTTIEMACEAGFDTSYRKGRIMGFDCDGDYTEEVRHLAELVRADEREACAKAIEDLLPDADRGDCAATIRART